MTNPATSDSADAAADQILVGVARALGLHVDADRVARLRPLAATLLRQGASLSTTIEPSLEPMEMGGVPPDTLGSSS